MKKTVELSPFILGVNYDILEEGLKDQELSDVNGFVLFQKTLKKDWGLSLNTLVLDYIEVVLIDNVPGEPEC